MEAGSLDLERPVVMRQTEVAQWHFMPAQASQPTATWERGDGCMVKQYLADGASDWCVQLSSGDLVRENEVPWWRKRCVASWQDAISAMRWLDCEYPAPFRTAQPACDHRADALSRRSLDLERPVVMRQTDVAQWHFMPAQASQPATWERGDGCMVKQSVVDGSSRWCVQFSNGDVAREDGARPWWRKRRMAYWEDASSAKHWLDREYQAPFRAAQPPCDHCGRGDLQAQLAHIFRSMPPAVAIVVGCNPAHRRARVRGHKDTAAILHG
jgi:hypothetical protein